MCHPFIFVKLPKTDFPFPFAKPLTNCSIQLFFSICLPVKVKLLLVLMLKYHILKYHYLSLLF